MFKRVLLLCLVLRAYEGVVGKCRYLKRKGFCGGRFQQCGYISCTDRQSKKVSLLAFSTVSFSQGRKEEISSSQGKRKEAKSTSPFFVEKEETTSLTLLLTTAETALALTTASSSTFLSTTTTSDPYQHHRHPRQRRKKYRRFPSSSSSASVIKEPFKGFKPPASSLFDFETSPPPLPALTTGSASSDFSAAPSSSSKRQLKLKGGKRGRRRFQTQKSVIGAPPLANPPNVDNVRERKLEKKRRRGLALRALSRQRVRELRGRHLVSSPPGAPSERSRPRRSRLSTQRFHLPWTRPRRRSRPTTLRLPWTRRPRHSSRPSTRRFRLPWTRGPRHSRPTTLRLRSSGSATPSASPAPQGTSSWGSTTPLGASLAPAAAAATASRTSRALSPTMASKRSLFLRLLLLASTTLPQTKSRPVTVNATKVVHCDGFDMVEVLVRKESCKYYDEKFVSKNKAKKYIFGLQLKCVSSLSDLSLPSLSVHREGRHPVPRLAPEGRAPASSDARADTAARSAAPTRP